VENFSEMVPLLPLIPEIHFCQQCKNTGRQRGLAKVATVATCLQASTHDK
jgi:hypothetical protein